MTNAPIIVNTRTELITSKADSDRIAFACNVAKTDARTNPTEISRKAPIPTRVSAHVLGPSGGATSACLVLTGRVVLSSMFIFLRAVCLQPVQHGVVAQQRQKDNGDNPPGCDKQDAEQGHEQRQPEERD